MTPHQTLLAWLEVTAPSWMNRNTLRHLLQQAQDFSPHADLEEALCALDDGQSPDAACERFFQDQRGMVRGAACGPAIEDALLALASQLPRWEWRGLAMRDLEQAVALSRRGDAAAMTRALGAFEARLEAGWEPYVAGPVAPDEVAAESVVGHRMLQAGVQAAYDAVGLLGARRYDEGLDMAEQAFRALVAVRKMNERLEVLYGGAEHEFLG